jgi:hypothetical protein
MADKHDERLKGYIVIALTASTGKKYEDCKVIPQGDIYPAIYSQVFGPASQKDCESGQPPTAASQIKLQSKVSHSSHVFFGLCRRRIGVRFLSKSGWRRSMM